MHVPYHKASSYNRPLHTVVEVSGIMQKFPIDGIKYTPSQAVVPSALRFSVGVRAVQKLKHMYAK